MDKNQSTYLTGLYINGNRTTSKPPSLTNELIISPEYDTHTSLPHPMDTRNQTVEFLKYSTYRTNLLKTEFLEYLMKEENFTNMNESEKFYREKAIENLNIINKNKSEIAKKKEEYKKIILELNKELNNNLAINKGDDEDYNKKKEDLLKKINLKKTDLNVLQSLYRKEYKERYLLIQKQKHEIENIKINLKQYEKYNLLNKKISIEANQKKNLLNDVKNYVEQSREVFAKEIDNKMKIYNDLEYEVLLLKQNTENIEKNILKIRDMKNKIKELIKQKKEINSNITDKNKYYQSIYFLTQLQIYKNTEMKNIELDTLIKNYNDIQNKMFKIKNDLFNTNQQIAYLNKTLHKLNDEYKEKQENNNEIRLQNKKNIKKINKNEDLFKNNFDEYILKDKYNSVKNKNKELEYLCNTKSNIMILYFKFLFEYTDIVYKSYDNSKVDFNFNLDSKYKFLKKIMESKYIELIKYNHNNFKKLSTNDEIFKEPEKFLLFAIKLFQNFFFAVKMITSNILNITCYNNEDLMIKFPLSQFNKSLITIKDSDKNNEQNVIINKESDKVEIISFNSEKNMKLYYQYLNESSILLSQKNKILARGINDILQNKNNIKKSSDSAMSTNYPTRVFTSFINNKNTHNDLKNSRYINNYPSTTLLSLKRFFGKENQDILFKGFKSADKNKEINNRYTKTKDSQNTIDTSSKMIKKNFTLVKPSKYKTNISQIKKKEKSDLYLSKEYNYELEIEESPNKIKKKNILGNNSRKIHFIKYSSEDPQKQLIFARMNDIRNLEVLTNNSNNNKSTNVNDIANDKIKESKFYEMYDKFKQKYFRKSSKIYSGNVKNYNRLNKNKKMDNNSLTNQSCSISNKNINIANGMKFIRNNSDFFYGVKTSKNGKEINKNEKLPYISNNKSNRHISSEFIDL